MPAASPWLFNLSLTIKFTTIMETNNKEIKRRSTFSLLFYINRTKVRKDGTCKLLCKVSIDAKSAPININAFVDPSLWNPETKRANGRSENARTVNLAIEKLTEKSPDITVIFVKASVS